MTAPKQNSPFVNRRATQRFDYREPCDLLLPSRRLRAVASNISAGGIAVELRGLGRADPGEMVQLRIQDFPTIQSCICWMSDRRVGLRFEEALDQHPEIRALLKRLEQGEISVPPENDGFDAGIRATIAKAKSGTNQP